ncbi:MAG TPA: DUF5320 domain-containing protein [Bacteroidota bacterium]|nr:DUF5320 domain-containing protein [Bacteroidota bacterium]
MPGFDGTGPAGRGPLTGGGRGPCDKQGADEAAKEERDDAKGLWPRGWGRGRAESERGQGGRRGGGRRGWGSGYGRRRAT